MHLPPLIRDLAIILAVAGIVTFIFHRIRQPVVLGYIIAGLIVGPFTPPFSFVTDIPSIQTWAELGIVFLMFSLGLEFSFRKLSRLGFAVTTTGILQIVGMIALGYLVGQAMGWRQIDSLFMGGMAAISSTTIILKAFEELNQRGKRFSDFVIGVLIIEDLAAIVLLVALSSLGAGKSLSLIGLGQLGFELIIVLGSWILIGYFVIPRFIRLVGLQGSDEMLLILSLGLCLALVSLAAHFQYSTALGAFIMGAILSETRESARIEKLIQPLKNLFAAIFFVSIGMLVNPHNFFDHWQSILVVLTLVIGGKIFLLFGSTLLTGKSISFSTQVALSMAQIGEFSFILAALGTSLHLTSEFLYPTVVVVSILSTFLTPYLIRNSDRISRFLEAKLPLRFRRSLQRYSHRLSSDYSVGPAQQILRRVLLGWAACFVLVTAVFFAADRFLWSFLLTWTPSTDAAKSLAWLLAVTLTAPFLWAMIFLFSQVPALAAKSGKKMAARMLGTYITLGWVLYLSLDLISFSLAFGLSMAAVALLFFVSQKNLESSYHWFVENFHLTFDEFDRDVKAPKELHHLAPWEYHLTRLTVALDSVWTGRSLEDLKLREKFGINLIAIQRGRRMIVAPQKHERLLGGDEILCLGGEQELDDLRKSLKEENKLLRSTTGLEDYILRPIAIGTKSILIGKTLLASRIREVFGGLVVGVERKAERYLNPSSEFIIEVGDVLWIVADRLALKSLESFSRSDQSSL